MTSSTCRRLLLMAALTIPLSFSRPASADTARSDSTSPGTAHDLAFYTDLALGARSLNLDGETLRSNRPGGTLVVRGDDVRTKGLVESNVRFGLRYRGWLLGAHVGLGLADWGSGSSQKLGDLMVRPNGFAATGLAAASFGYRFESGPYGARVEGVVGGEAVGLGMERPSFPDTRIPYVNTVRFVAAPRFTFERASRDVSFGVFVQMEPLAPSNVLFGISITPWAWIW